MLDHANNPEARPEKHVPSPHPFRTEARMRHGTPPRESMFSQIVVGVVVSLVSTVLLKGVGLDETSPPPAKSASSVRVAFASPEPTEPAAVTSCLFDSRAVSTDPALGFVPESLRLRGLP